MEQLNRLWKKGQDFLGVQYPIMAGAMTWISNHRFVSAVCNTGGFGCLAAGNMPPELLEADNEAGYSLVRTGSGAEGWVLNRYLLQSPPASVRLPDIESKLQQSEESRRKLAGELRSLQQERQELQGQIKTLDNSGQDLQQQLNKVRQLSAGAIQMDDQNQRLKQRVIDNERLLEELSFEAPEMKMGRVEINAAYVRERLDDIAKDEDLSKFIL